MASAGTLDSASSSNLQDRSGTITAGGSPQALLAASNGRQGWLIQNLSAGDLFVNDVAAAALDTGFKIPAGAILDSSATPAYPARNALSIWGATTGQKFTAREF